MERMKKIKKRFEETFELPINWSSTKVSFYIKTKTNHDFQLLEADASKIIIFKQSKLLIFT